MLAALSQRMFQDINASSLQITMIINKQKKNNMLIKVKF